MSYNHYFVIFILCNFKYYIDICKYFIMNSDEDPEGITFFEFINDNYNQEKNKLKNLCGKFNTILFDEDIFHDTIIKVNDIIRLSSLFKRCL